MEVGRRSGGGGSVRSTLSPSPGSPGSTVRYITPIGGTTQILVDDHIIASSTNLSRTLHSPVAVRAITADAEWERGYTMGVLGTSVLQDGLKIRVWYTLRNNTIGCGASDQPPCSAHDPPQPNYGIKPILTAYAESTDGGRSFGKPLLHHAR
eukprot:SAG31_NODE_14154_length_824_cov_1.342069_1_plen_152_part_00